MQPLALLALLPARGGWGSRGCCERSRRGSSSCFSSASFCAWSTSCPFRLPRAELGAFDRAHGPELVNRFFDIFTIQKAAASLLLGGLELLLAASVGDARPGVLPPVPPRVRSRAHGYRGRNPVRTRPGCHRVGGRRVEGEVRGRRLARGGRAPPSRVQARGRSRPRSRSRRPASLHVPLVPRETLRRRVSTARWARSPCRCSRAQAFSGSEAGS